MKKVGIIGCSDGLAPEKREQMDRLQTVLKNFDLETARADYIFEDERTYPGNGKMRAAELMKLYDDPTVTDIFDVSGGNQGNEVLADLDYDKIRKSPAIFWGYSDLTTVINAIYTKTGKSSMLYQGKFLVGDKGTLQQKRFAEYLSCCRNLEDTKKVIPEDTKKASPEDIRKASPEHAKNASRLEQFHPADCQLTNIEATCVQGGPLEGILVGGNIRCFLKLAGTEYFPDLTDKILLLEAWSGQLPQILTYLNQYKQMGAFSKVKGFLLGTFTEYERNAFPVSVVDLLRDLVGPELPIYKTREIGHGHDAKAAVIGGWYSFS